MADSYNEFFGIGTHGEQSTILGWWKMQETSGTTVSDETTNGNDGTLQGGSDIGYIYTSGPTSWLSSAFDLNGMADYVSCGTIAGYSKTTAFSVGLWVRPDAAINSFQTFMARQRQPSTLDGWTLRVGGPGSREKLAFYLHDGSDNMYRIADSNVFSSSQWYFVGASYSGSNSVSGINLYLNGSSIASTAGSDSTLSGTINYSSSSELAIGARDEDQGGIFDGRVSGAFVIQKSMSSSEWDEVYDGPEPLNTMSASISGDTEVGSTLTCDSGSWDSQSNGTVTISYSWRRNGTIITGANLSSYTTVSADIGNDVDCVVKASNDGGSDSGEWQTTNSITVTSSSGGFGAQWGAYATATVPPVNIGAF